LWLDGGSSEQSGHTAKEAAMTNAPSTMVSVRYMIDDVDAAVAFYTNYFGFTLGLN
jgi:predicted enzyme related to lactoylglutathione lyase